MDNNRKKKRWPLIKNLRVFEQGTENLMGRLVDITDEGMMLASQEPILSGIDYDLWVEIVTEKVAIHARSQWTKKDLKRGYYHTGFSFLEPSEKTKMNIKCLIEALKDK